MNVPETKSQLRGILGFFRIFGNTLKQLCWESHSLTWRLSVSRKISSRSGQKAFCGFANIETRLDQCLRVKSTYDSSWQTLWDFCRQLMICCRGPVVSKGWLWYRVSYFFFSCKLTDTQRNWATIEWEAYAVLVAVRKFKHWFFGSKLIIHSDQNPITYLTVFAPKSSKLMRWCLALAKFDVEFHFKARKMNVPADTLYRPGSGAFDSLGDCK